MKKNKVFRLSLGWQIILGLVIGVILGVVFADNKKFIAFANGLGSTFINMISMIVLPIVVSSLIVGISNMGDIKKLLLPYKGKIADTLREMQEDLQSAISYAGGKELLALRKVDYVIVKNSIYNGDML